MLEMKKSKKDSVAVAIILSIFELYGILFYLQHYFWDELIMWEYEDLVLMSLAMICIVIGIVRFLSGKQGPLGLIVIIVVMPTFVLFALMSSAETTISEKLSSVLKKINPKVNSK